MTKAGFTVQWEKGYPWKFGVDYLYVIWNIIWNILGEIESRRMFFVVLWCTRVVLFIEVACVREDVLCGETSKLRFKPN